MPSNTSGPVDPWQALPPELDPRRGRRHISQPETGGRAVSPLPPHLDPRRGSGSRRTSSDLVGGLGLGVRIASAILSLLVLLGSGLAWATYRNFTADIKRVNAIGGNTANIDGKDQNILIVGADDRQTATDAELAELGTTRDGGSLLTDTMMLLHVPADGSKATLISFPRDSYVEVPGYGKRKLNSAYTIGMNNAHGDRNAGARLLVASIEKLTGLKVDHYAQVDLIGFYRISNAIGGIGVCLKGDMKPSTVAGAEGPGLDAGYEPDGSYVYSYTGINLHKGYNVIKGKQALAFVRQRHGLPRGDLDRIQRQQYFLSAVFRKMTSAGVLLNPFKQQNLLKAVSKSITMDPGLDPIKLAAQVQNLQAGNFTLATIPTEPDTQNVQIDGITQNVVVIDDAKLPDFISTVLGQDPSNAVKKATAAAKGSFTVGVLNGSGENGLATANTKALNAAGFRAVVDQGDPGSVAATTIRYASGHEGQAKALLTEIPGALLQHDNAATQTTVVIGANKVQAKALMPSKSSAPAPTQSAKSSSGLRTAADASCIN